MYISELSIVNYRNFANAKFKFEKGINTIIGENGSGKTNLFRAIRLLLDDNLLSSAYKLREKDFNRSLSNFRGHWIIISIEFSELSDDEAVQSLFVHGSGDFSDENVQKATYNLFFRPKANIRFSLSELKEGDSAGLNQILGALSIEDYEAFFTGKSTADFNDPEVYKELVGDFESVKFNYEPDSSKYGVKIPHQLSISKEVSFTFIKALRDVVSDFHNNRTNPLFKLLRNKSRDINEQDYGEISESVENLNKLIEELPDVINIREDIKSTIKDAVGQTYSPSSLGIESNLPSEAERLLQSLQLLIGEPNEDHQGSIQELSLGGANLIFLTLKLLEYKYQIQRRTFANFLLIEEPEAHIHTHIQKTLFENLDYGDTQIIYSTHSTHISEVSRIERMNILSKKRNFAEVYQPSTNLSTSFRRKVQRYLDAVRSNLLFAKGVILVEGDAEEILVPTLVKSILGLSLDELGISLINIRSTGFANLAKLFHDDRIQRRCSILTDLDKSIADTTVLDTDDQQVRRYKNKLAGSEKSGKERQALLETMCKGNDWIKAFYANHTFEIDLFQSGNKQAFKDVSRELYEQEKTIKDTIDELNSDDIAVWGKRLLTMANGKGKGWFSIQVGEFVDSKVKVPEYIMDAVFFARQHFDRETICEILNHRIFDPTARKLINDFKSSNESLSDFVGTFEMIGFEDEVLGAINNSEYVYMV